MLHDDYSPVVTDTKQWIYAAVLLTLCVSLGGLHLLKQWPSSDYIHAMATGQYSRAGEHLQPQLKANNPKAQNSLANLYYLGLGHEIDYPRAAKLYHAAATQGFGSAQMNLGHLYKQGLGVMKSAERAFAWYNQANIADHEWAEYYMSQISVELTLTPLQMSTVKTRWRKLSDLSAEPL